jgi:hypothetical protein
VCPTGPEALSVLQGLMCVPQGLMTGPAGPDEGRVQHGLLTAGPVHRSANAPAQAVQAGENTVQHTA